MRPLAVAETGSAASTSTGSTNHSLLHISTLRAFLQICSLFGLIQNIVSEEADVKLELGFFPKIAKRPSCGGRKVGPDTGLGLAIRQIGVHVIFCHGPRTHEEPIPMVSPPDPAGGSPSHPIVSWGEMEREMRKRRNCIFDSVKAFSCPRGEDVIGRK